MAKTRWGPIRSEDWLWIEPERGASRWRSAKETAVIISVSKLAIEQAKDALGLARRDPAVVVQYRGVNRMGLLPKGFGGSESDKEVAFLVGKSTFGVNPAIAWVPGVHYGYGELRRSELKESVTYIPQGAEIVDRMAAQDVPESIPLV